MEQMNQIIDRFVMGTTRWQESASCADLQTEANELYRCLCHFAPNYDYSDPTVAKTLSSLIAWVWRADQVNAIGLNYDKGLWLYGPIGTGKSTMLLGLRKYMNSVTDRFHKASEDYRLKAWYKSASEIANDYAAKGSAAIIDYCDANTNIIIDELGREPIPANNYGTRLNVLQHIMQIRYDHRRESMTHVTTNLALEDVARYYGTYVADRCVEMFNFVHMDGNSRRQ
jgi:DNA replication protein DnaC